MSRIAKPVFRAIRQSVDKPNANACAHVIGPVVADSCHEISIEHQTRIHIAAKLQFGRGRPCLVGPVIGNLQIQFRPVIIGKWLLGDQAHGGLADIGIAISGFVVLDERDERQAGIAVGEGQANQRRKLVGPRADALVGIPGVQDPLDPDRGFEPPGLAQSAL